ncbi:hypothetical protein ACSLPG_31340, partial [Escherichia coli]|uniref:hypothetical protein n=1 Tax=Escherichia coli TaxID=562 RepID=UPI003EE2DDD6
ALIHHGVEFISQEGKQVCIVFTNEQGLTTFETHLAQIAPANTGHIDSAGPSVVLKWCFGNR